jgi:hypothetical protein
LWTRRLRREVRQEALNVARLAGSHKSTVNEALGVVEVRDQAALEQLQPKLEQAALAASREFS